MIINSKEMAGLLNIKPTTLRKIKSQGLLEEKLKAIGYTIVEEFKEGRSVYYRLNETAPTDAVALFNKEVFGTKHDGFKDYYMNRTEFAKGQDSKVDDVITKQEMGKMVNADPETITSWDNKLLEMEILSEDGYVYLRFCNFQVYESNRDEYSGYMRRVRVAKEKHSSIMLAYKRGLTDDKGRLLVNDITVRDAQEEYEEALKGFARDYVTKIAVYKLNKNNPIHVEAVRVYTENHK